MDAMLRLLVVCAFAGCYGDGWSYACTADAQCGSDGICSDGHCAFVDTSCTSGYRYGELSGPAANECVTQVMPTCQPSYLVCDGFEGTSLDAKWTPDGPTTIDTTVAHRGSSSLHLHTNALAVGATAQSRVAEQVTLANRAPTVWARAWMRVSQLPLSTNVMEVADTEQSGGTGGNYLLVRANDIALYSGFDTRVSGGSVQVPTNSWFCVIWKIDRAITATGSLALDGDPFTPFTLANVVTDNTNAIATTRFGISWVAPNVDVAQPAVDLWIDDIITSNAAVTCAD